MKVTNLSTPSWSMCVPTAATSDLGSGWGPSCLCRWPHLSAAKGLTGLQPCGFRTLHVEQDAGSKIQWVWVHFHTLQRGQDLLRRKEMPTWFIMLKYAEIIFCK